MEHGFVLLGGDTVAPSGLYARLCHAFLVFFIFYYDQSYLRIYWTDFHDLFTKWKVFAWIFLIRSNFFQLLMGRCHGNLFCVISKTQTMCDFFLQFLHHMKAFWVSMIDLNFFFNISREKKGQNYLPLHLSLALSFQNGIGYRYLYVLVNSVNDASKSC